MSSREELEPTSGGRVSQRGLLRKLKPKHLNPSASSASSSCDSAWKSLVSYSNVILVHS